MPAHAARSAAPFLSTQWSRVLALRGAGEDTQATALASLCQAYWFPLYAFARHRGLSRHDAEDAVQSFFTDTGDAVFFKKADAEKGRLRTFILTAFTRHLGSLRTHAGAMKRGGRTQVLSIDHDQVEEWMLADQRTGDESGTLSFERHWARNILRTVIAGLEASAGHGSETQKRFKILSRFLNPETCHDFTIRQAAEQLGMTPSACDKAVQRLRQNFRLAVRDQVAATLEKPTDATILEEMQQLQRALAG
jgi:DNA-directed RNA polymerase specialized sigma24 family protein